jgi:hypothetical protein
MWRPQRKIYCGDLNGITARYLIKVRADRAGSSHVFFSLSTLNTCTCRWALEVSIRTFILCLLEHENIFLGFGEWHFREDFQGAAAAAGGHV